MAKVRKLIMRDYAYSQISSKERAAIAASMDEGTLQGTDDEVHATLDVA